MSDQTQEKEKSLAELMVRILKEPLKPLGESLQGLDGELSDIKADLELVIGTVADGLKKSDDAARRRSSEALEALRTLRHEQGEGMATLRDSLAEHAQAGVQALDTRLSESRTALAQSEHRVLDAVASVSEEQRSATHTLGALSSQFSEFSEGLKKSDDAARQRSNEALEALQTLCVEQGEGVATLQESLAEHARARTQALDALLSESRTTLAQSERRVLDAVASVVENQRSATHSLAALSDQLHDNRAALDNALIKWEAGVVTANAAVASGLKAGVAEIGQRLELQHKASQAAHQALLNDIKGAAEHTQAVMAENLQAGHALRDSLASGQAGVIDALNQHAEVLNARLDQSQAKLRQLTITTGVFFVSMLAYVAYELLSRFT